MKLCVISPGVVHAVPRTVAMADQFEEIHFIDTAGSADCKNLEANGIFYYSPSDIKASCIHSLSLQRLFQKINPDAIICHYASGDHFFGAILFGKCPVAAICMGHDLLYERGITYIPLMRRLLIRMGLRRVAYLSVKSNYLVKRILSFNITCPIDLNYWGADCTVFKIKGDKKYEIKNISHCTPILLSPRAVDPTYNIKLIVLAFKKISSTFPNAKLVILGRSSSKYKNEVKKLVLELDLVDNVTFVDEVSQTVLPEYYRSADVVISMARSEGFPNTILEVMACNIPVIVGRIPQVEELLIDGYNARLCDFDSSEVVQAIIDVLDNPEKTNEILANASKTVKTYGNIRKNALRFSNQLKEIVAQGKKYNSFLDRVVFLIVYVIYIVQRKFFLR